MNKSESVCGMCGKEVKYSWKLENHKLNCLSNPNQECPICSKIFATRESLIKHKNRAHKGERYYTCSKCNAGFSKQAFLMKHIQNDHPCWTDWKLNFPKHLLKAISNVGDGASSSEANDDTIIIQESELHQVPVAEAVPELKRNSFQTSGESENEIDAPQLQSSKKRKRSDSTLSTPAENVEEAVHDPINEMGYGLTIEKTEESLPEKTIRRLLPSREAKNAGNLSSVAQQMALNSPKPLEKSTRKPNRGKRAELPPCQRPTEEETLRMDDKTDNENENTKNNHPNWREWDDVFDNLLAERDILGLSSKDKEYWNLGAEIFRNIRNKYHFKKLRRDNPEMQGPSNESTNLVAVETLIMNSVPYKRLESELDEKSQQLQLFEQVKKSVGQMNEKLGQLEASIELKNFKPNKSPDGNTSRTW